MVQVHECSCLACSGMAHTNLYMATMVFKKVKPVICLENLVSKFCKTHALSCFQATLNTEKPQSENIRTCKS